MAWRARLDAKLDNAAWSATMQAYFMLASAARLAARFGRRTDARSYAFGARTLLAAFGERRP